jgi:hypothetical protein
MKLVPCLSLLLAAAVLTPASAQVAPAVAPNSSAAASANATKGEEAIVLSPFTISSDEDKGYAASSALAGTRTNEKLANLPNSISVFTADFLSDLALNDFFGAYATGAPLCLFPRRFRHFAIGHPFSFGPSAAPASTVIPRLPAGPLASATTSRPSSTSTTSSAKTPNRTTTTRGSARSRRGVMSRPLRWSGESGHPSTGLSEAMSDR